MKTRNTLSVVTRTLALSALLVAGSQPAGASESETLIQKVRGATQRYLNINTAFAEGWVTATPCVSGPDTGAMGVHLVLQSRIASGETKSTEPQALIYEPKFDGSMRLVGVEFIVLASIWSANNPAGSVPAVDGNLMNFVPAPNRYGLPAFYELHVWAWERNPKGSFADWNTQVSCEQEQPAA
ncbi:MAG TPA: hypothetical protein VHV81_05190 [Steroidobacteraceae bacterium]|jgi:hypothetical protein|nr:hypothetical protein [Steroidobacteraceae bacterium]